MTETDWKELQEAFILLRNSPAITRLDAALWCVYKVGLNIRIDIKG